jgi:hypothetical protein
LDGTREMTTIAEREDRHAHPVETTDADSVEPMATAAPSESTPQRLAAIREQMKLLSDYL